MGVATSSLGVTYRDTVRRTAVVSWLLALWEDLDAMIRSLVKTKLLI
jgi:hypothetical protein